jgi:hypothetical protein
MRQNRIAADSTRNFGNRPIFGPVRARTTCLIVQHLSVPGDNPPPILGRIAPNVKRIPVSRPARSIW